MNNRHATDERKHGRALQTHAGRARTLSANTTNQLKHITMKTTSKEFSQMIDQMQELKDSGHVWVEVERLDKFCDLCRVFGFNPQGGALSNDCKTQCLYIDRPARI